MTLTKLTIEQRRQIPALYAVGHNTVSIGKMFNADRKVISSWLRKAGVEGRKHSHPLRMRCSVDHTAFDVLTPEACYWIGLMFTDGTMSHRPRRSPYLSLGLTESDKDQVYGLAAFLKSTYKVSRKEPIIGGEGIWNSAAYYHTTFISQHLHDRLKELGYARLDSDPVLELRRSRDFWRGVIDGDGFVCITNGTAKTGVTKGRRLVDAFLEYARSIYPDCRATSYPIRTVFRTQLAGKCAEPVIADMYYPGAVAIRRKAEKAAEIIRWSASRVVA
jgi:hypothetical protein